MPVSNECQGRNITGYQKLPTWWYSSSTIWARLASCPPVFVLIYSLCCGGFVSGGDSDVTLSFVVALASSAGCCCTVTLKLWLTVYAAGWTMSGWGHLSLWEHWMTMDHWCSLDHTMSHPSAGSIGEPRDERTWAQVRFRASNSNISPLTTLLMFWNVLELRAPWAGFSSEGERDSWRMRRLVQHH